jgi:hypothetical protein
MIKYLIKGEREKREKWGKNERTIILPFSLFPLSPFGFM